MSDKTEISWTDATWSPVQGCTKVSEGCDHCYIDRTPPFRMNHIRFSCPRCSGTGLVEGGECHRCDGNGRIDGPGDTTGVRLLWDQLDKPMHWRKPRKVFVCSMADLFHQAVTDEFIARVFAVMAMCPRHTFQVLTKRPARMRHLLNSDEFWRSVCRSVVDDLRRVEEAAGLVRNPLPNVWIGTSVESQEWADVRIPPLMQTPAAVRFLSCEPLLGPIDLCRYLAVGSVQLGKNFAGQVALDDEQAVERTEHRLNIADAGNLPGADRLPAVPNRAVAVPADASTPHGHRKPVDQLNGGAVDRHDGRVLPVRPAAPLDVSLPVEKPCDVAEGSRIGGHVDAGWAEPLTSSTDSASGNHASSNGLAGYIEALGDLRDGESGQVGADDVGGSRTSVGHDLKDTRTPGIHWIICGGESGPKARPMHPGWARSLRDQCVSAGVAFHFKQWGEWAPRYTTPRQGFSWPDGRFVEVVAQAAPHPLLGADQWSPAQADVPIVPGWIHLGRVGKKAAGRMLDGRTWDEYPPRKETR